jgi:ribonucleases P/MRP protein subunit RPP40
MKGAKKMRNEKDREELQEVFNKLYEWALAWGMEFNIPKCKVMHVGRGNPRNKYNMNGVEFQAVDEETDIGIVAHRALKPAKQCEKATNRAKSVLNLIRRNVHYRDWKVFVNLYKQYVRPYLEFSSPAGSPWLEADIEKLENVQKTPITMVSGLRSINYEVRCREIGIQTLSLTRKFQDISWNINREREYWTQKTIWESGRQVTTPH